MLPKNSDHRSCRVSLAWPSPIRPLMPVLNSTCIRTRGGNFRRDRRRGRRGSPVPASPRGGWRRRGAGFPGWRACRCRRDRGPGRPRGRRARAGCRLGGARSPGAEPCSLPSSLVLIRTIVEVDDPRARDEELAGAAVVVQAAGDERLGVAPVGSSRSQASIRSFSSTIGTSGSTLRVIATGLP